MGYRALTARGYGPFAGNAGRPNAALKTTRITMEKGDDVQTAGQGVPILVSKALATWTRMKRLMNRNGSTLQYMAKIQEVSPVKISSSLFCHG
ncbi:hypothetical protein Tco_1074161 [Tanacetum coccineum]